MRTIAMPCSGELLLAHLMSYGLLVALDAAGVDAYVHHPPQSLSFTPAVDVDDDIDDETIAAAVRATAVGAEDVIEADLVPGKAGNDRHSVIWARHTLNNDKTKASDVVERRSALVRRASESNDHVVLGILAGLGAPASWGPDSVHPSDGATALDGVIGNIGADLVRSVMRKGRNAASVLDPADLWTTRPPRGKGELDKTGWSPPETIAPLPHQWLAVLGLGLLPVAHRRLEPSVTPACWSTGRPRTQGITVPLFSRATTLARVRAIVGLRALTTIAIQPNMADASSIAAAADLRAVNVSEVVTFGRLVGRQVSSFSFTFRRGRRLAL